MNFHAAKLTVSFLVSILSLTAFACTTKGKVTDAKTAEPLVGAIVSIENTKYKTVVNPDGSFVFRNIQAGKICTKSKKCWVMKMQRKKMLPDLANGAKEFILSANF